jgi:hypothetical protein
MEGFLINLVSLVAMNANPVKFLHNGFLIRSPEKHQMHQSDEPIV